MSDNINIYPALGQMAATLAEGVNTLSQEQTVVFTQYVRVVLPLDGYVFWVKADLLSQGALFNAFGFNKKMLDEITALVTPAPTITVQGSLHYASTMEQNEDETGANNDMIFTSLAEVRDLNQMNPNILYIAVWDEIEFAFGMRTSFYRQANLYHYRGVAVHPGLKTQIISTLADFDDTHIIVSNSLPLWLSMDPSNPPWPGGIPGASQRIPLYPSFLVPDNILPPWGSVHVLPESQEALQAAPFTDRQSNQWQLVAERVRITLYGARNFNVMDYIAYVQEFCANTELMGIMNMPIPKDEKRTQPELSIIAQKKTVEFKVNYYQARAREVARQFILSCIPTYVIP